MSQTIESASQDRPAVLVTGATGYIGGRLIELLENEPVQLRALARHPEELQKHVKPTTQVITGDVLDPPSLKNALNGIDTAYYLVHLMAQADDFEKQDREAATNFATAAREANVRRIIYMGGLGDENDPCLSPHLRSRQEVGKILRESGVPTIEFRASVVVGAGSLSFELIRTLADRLPVMLWPKWMKTRTQPIAVDDMLAYLLAARTLEVEGSTIFEVGGSDVVPYGQLVREYANQKHLHRLMINVPLLTPYLSSLWLTLVTPTAFTVARHLIEGLKNPTVVTNRKALDAFSIRPMGIKEAIAHAIA